LYKIAELSSGGESVALMLGGRLVNPHTQDLAERRLLNVVEEMALASGVPVPPVYCLDKEPSINAFAAGRTPANAVVAVSRGALTYLNRDELQGVMAHEFSHVLNGDMRLDLRLIGLLNGILILAILGYYLLRIGAQSSGGSNKKGGGAGLMLLGLGMLIIGYIGVVFGRLIKAAVSRQREYLADASAVQFTRYPGGIAGALKKIGGLSESSRIKDAHAEECSHMFFADAFAGSWMNLLATHPPLAERIRRIEPDWSGVFPPVKPVPAAEVGGAAQAAVAGEEVRPAPDELRAAVEQFRAAAQQRRAPGPKTVTLDPTGITSRMGLPGVAQIAVASAMLDAMTPSLRDASRQPYSARAVVYALLLNREEDLREKQLADLKSRIEEPSYRETLQLAAEVDRMAEEARLPLVDVTLPALKSLSRDQYAAFRDTVEALVAADGKVDLFEYVVQAVLLHNLDVHFNRIKPPAVRYQAITPLLSSLGTMLSTVAYAGQDNPPDAQQALDQAAATLGQPMTLLPREQCTLRAFDQAMGDLAQASPQIKRRVLTAAAACVAADGKVTVNEGELLRVIAALLGCPMPSLALPTAGDASA
jgi:Zn-dependent protease with chaperone function